MASSSKEMSATIVRKDAYKALITAGPEGGYTIFREKYGWFYREFTGQIYREIIEVVQDLSPADIAGYIETTKLPKKSKSKTASTPKPTKPKTRKKKGAVESSSSNSE